MNKEQKKIIKEVIAIKSKLRTETMNKIVLAQRNIDQLEEQSDKLAKEMRDLES